MKFEAHAGFCNPRLDRELLSLEGCTFSTQQARQQPPCQEQECDAFTLTLFSSSVNTSRQSDKVVERGRALKVRMSSCGDGNHSGHINVRA
jgi:hypothetical protein